MPKNLLILGKGACAIGTSGGGAQDINCMTDQFSNNSIL